MENEECGYEKRRILLGESFGYEISRYGSI
jgi:hypothetical protein